MADAVNRCGRVLHYDGCRSFAYLEAGRNYRPFVLAISIVARSFDSAVMPGMPPSG